MQTFLKSVLNRPKLRCFIVLAKVLAWRGLSMLNKVFVQNVSVKTVPVEVTQLCQTLDDIFSVKNDFSTFNALSLLYLLQLFIESDLTPNSRQLLTGESFVEIM